jgi:exodeoxyribonuclease VIII
MTWREYFALEAVNWTSLKVIADSPKHYKYALDHPREDTAALAIGRYVHAAVLQPETIADDFAIWTEGDRRGNKWKDFAEQNAGRTIFKQSEIDEMIPLIEAMRAVVAPFLTPTAQVEQVIEWTDPKTGIRCKARPDIYDPASRALVDLKTTRSIDIRRFGHDVCRFGYHGQFAHYNAGITHALGWEPVQHLLIGIEKEPPHDVGVFPLDADTRRVGVELVESLLDRLAECRASNAWPGRHPDPVTLGPANLPPWLYGGGIPEIAFLEDSP